MRLWAFLIGQRTGPETSFQEIYRNLLEDAGLAESLGYHGVWIAEHHFTNYCAIPNPLMLAAAIGQRTRHLRIGTAVIVLPLHNPVRVAEDIAEADHLTGGRLEVGIGRGYSAYEFMGLSTSIEDSHALLSEGLDVLFKLWAGPDVEHSGPHWSFPTLTATPACLQQPHPPLWHAAGSPNSFASALDRGMNSFIAVGLRGRGFVDQFRAVFEEECRKRGLDPAGQLFGAQLLAHSASDPAEVERGVEAGRQMYTLTSRLMANRQRVSAGLIDSSERTDAEQVPDEQILSGSLIGGEEDLRRHLEWLEEIGVTDLSLNFRYGDLDTPSVHHSMREVARVAGLRER